MQEEGTITFNEKHSFQNTSLRCLTGPGMDVPVVVCGLPVGACLIHLFSSQPLWHLSAACLLLEALSPAGTPLWLLQAVVSHQCSHPQGTWRLSFCPQYNDLWDEKIQMTLKIQSPLAFLKVSEWLYSSSFFVELCSKESRRCSWHNHPLKGHWC